MCIRDSSLVRGTTCHKIVKMLYEAGANEIHVRIACPEIKYPDFYGIDMPSKKELLAANKSLNEMNKFIGSDTLSFLSLDGLYKGLCFKKRNNIYPQFTDHYFTGEYPIERVDQNNDKIVSQLSLLSGKSNN